jgi:hypothetical protein
MSTAQRRNLTAIWLLLMLATALSWWFGSPHRDGVHVGASIAVLLIAFVKVRLVMWHFMELRHAPRPLRWLADGWIALCCSVLLGLYWIGLR